MEEEEIHIEDISNDSTDKSDQIDSSSASYEYEYELHVEEVKAEPVVDTSDPLSYFNKTAIKCILNEAMDQLYILRNINTQDNANFINSPIEYISIADRYMGAENHAIFRINSSINNYEKLARDIHRIIQVIRDCLDDINMNCKFKSLLIAVSALKRLREDERKLIEEKEKNDLYIVDLRKQCEEELLHNIRVLEATNDQIQKLRFEVEDLLVYTNYELIYFKNWEEARREQNTMLCEKKEQFYQKIIDDTQANIYSENRCHMELENYIEESKNDYLDEIQYWMKHYDEETEKRETEMMNLKANMEKLIEDHLELKEKYESRKQEIEQWLEYKRKKKEKEELEALRLWAVTKIQAWWRGVMVRKKLGPYRKKKGKGKEKDKKGKKGKKK